MTELFYEILGGWIRAVLVALSAWLLSHHLITADQGDRLTSELFAHIMLVAPGVLAMLWTAIAKYRSRVKFLTALEMPAGTTEDDVKARVMTGGGVPIATVVLAVGLLLSSGGLFAACHPPASIVTPAGKQAYTADQVVARLNEFQNAVIATSDAGRMRLADARAIVTWISGDINATPPKTGLVQAIGAAPGGGWRAVALQEWPAIRSQLAGGPLEQWVEIIDGLLAGGQ